MKSHIPRTGPEKWDAALHGAARRVISPRLSAKMSICDSPSATLGRIMARIYTFSGIVNGSRKPRSSPRR